MTTGSKFDPFCSKESGARLSGGRCLYAEFKYNDHLEDEPHFSLKIEQLDCFSNIEKNEMKKKDEIKRKYILPNFSFGTPGRLASIDETLKDGDQFMVLGNERFQVPELLFNPNDAMIRQVEYF